MGRKKLAFKRKSSLQPAIAELERAYLHFMKRFPTLESIDPPRIVIQTKGRRKNIAGWFAPQRWDTGQSRINEITIAAESLSRPLPDIAATLIHEMVHADNYSADIPDTSGRYHNQRVKSSAEHVGLIIEKAKYIGWAVTRLGPELHQEVAALHLNEKAFAAFRIPLPEPEKQPTRMKKWECNCTVVRCATDLEAICNACGQSFVYADKDAPHGEEQRQAA